jgi:hypothetical protein
MALLAFPTSVISMSFPVREGAREAVQFEMPFPNRSDFEDFALSKSSTSHLPRKFMTILKLDP